MVCICDYFTVFRFLKFRSFFMLSYNLSVFQTCEVCQAVFRHEAVHKSHLQEHSQGSLLTKEDSHEDAQQRVPTSFSTTVMLSSSSSKSPTTTEATMASSSPYTFKDETSPQTNVYGNIKEGFNGPNQKISENKTVVPKHFKNENMRDIKETLKKYNGSAIRNSNFSVINESLGDMTQTTRLNKFNPPILKTPILFRANLNPNQTSADDVNVLNLKSSHISLDCKSQSAPTVTNPCNEKKEDNLICRRSSTGNLIISKLNIRHTQALCEDQVNSAKIPKIAGVANKQKKSRKRLKRNKSLMKQNKRRKTANNDSGDGLGVKIKSSDTNRDVSVGNCYNVEKFTKPNRVLNNLEEPNLSITSGDIQEDITQVVSSFLKSNLNTNVNINESTNEERIIPTILGSESAPNLINMTTELVSKLSKEEAITIPPKHEEEKEYKEQSITAHQLEVSLFYK